MKIIVIAQHHGVFLTLQSLFDLKEKDIHVIVPGAQDEKYAKMYAENLDKKEYKVFDGYAKRVDKFCGKRAKVYLMPDFRIQDTINSVLCFMRANDMLQDFVHVIGAGAVVTKKLPKEPITNLFAFATDRMYDKVKHLNMYHMLGLPRDSTVYDTFSFQINGAYLDPDYCSRSDRYIVNTSTMRKQIQEMARGLNHRHDILIGSAVSARETVSHNIWAREASILNYWAKSMVRDGVLLTEEVFGYPLDIYADVAKKVKKWLPESTYKNITRNGSETKYWVGDILQVFLQAK